MILVLHGEINTIAPAHRSQSATPYLCTTMDNFPNIQMTMAAGEPSSPRPEPTDLPTLRTCPDCGTEGTGSYCTNCGEAMEPALPPVHHYIKELVNDIAAFDSKLIRTVPALLFRPGFLTKEYIAGRRNRYLVPSRLYLLTGLLVFFLLGSFLHKTFLESTSHPNSQTHYAFGSVKGEEARRDVDKFIGLAVTVSPYVILIGSTPIFAFVLWVLYRKKGRKFVEHLIFSFHFFAFALIVLLAGIILSSTIAAIIGFVLFLIYLFIAMQRVYDDRGFGLVMRFFTVSMSYFTIAGIAITISLVVAFYVGVYSGELPDIIHQPLSPADSLLRDSLQRHGGGGPSLHFDFTK